MRRLICVLSVLLLFAGCSSEDGSFDGILSLRDRLLKCGSCTFDAVIVADYSDRYYTFAMHCQMDQNGNITFCVKEPETIAGISGTLSGSGGALTFDDKILAFEMMADGSITPVSAPWHMMEALRSGYLCASGEYEDGLFVQINDSYMGGQLQADIWLTDETVPQSCELYWEGIRFLSVRVSNFEIM